MRLYFASEYKNSSNIVVLVCQLQLILKNMNLILQSGYAVHCWECYTFLLCRCRHRRSHHHEILHPTDCNTALVVVNLQDLTLDVQVLPLSLESQKIESLVNQHQDLARTQGPVRARLCAAAVSRLLGSELIIVSYLTFSSCSTESRKQPILTPSH